MIAAGAFQHRQRVLESSSSDSGGSSVPPERLAGHEVKLEIDPITRELTIVKPVALLPAPEPAEHIFSIDIGDLQRLEDYVKNLRAHIVAKVFGHLEVAENASRLDKAYLLYDNLRRIRANYAAERDKLNEKAEYLKRITEFTLSFAQNASSADLSRVITEKSVDIDAYNKFLLLQLLEKLDAEMGELRRAVVADLPAIFEEFDHAARQALSGYQMVNKNIELSFRLTIFDSNELTHRVDSIILIARKITDNQNYHHIAAVSNPQMTFHAGLVSALVPALLLLAL